MIAALVVLILSFTISAATVVARRPHPQFWSSVRGTELEVRVSMVERLGRRTRLAFGQPADPTLDRATGAGLVAVVSLAPLHVGLGMAAGVGVWARSMLHRRRVAHQNADRVGAGLGDAIDLFAVALLSGNTVAEAVRQVAEWSDDEIARAFAWSTRQVAVGRTLGDALEEIPARLGPQVRPLIAALVATERYGAPITANLAQLAIDTRSDRRRRAEASARRLPVVLLFPLVSCILPAFLLVTVVPVIFETVANFQISASPGTPP